MAVPSRFFVEKAAAVSDICTDSVDMIEYPQTSEGGEAGMREEHIGKVTLLQSEEEFRLTRDALALSAFVTLHNRDRVCDLGCGVGNVLLPLANRAEGLILDGVELRESAAELCREGLRRSGLTGCIVTGDLKERYSELPWGRYDVVVANPPYFPQQSGAVSPKEARALARTQDSYTLEAACHAAWRLCRTGGRFALCLRPERLTELILALTANAMEPKRMQLIQSKVDRAPNLVLVEAVKGAKPGLKVLPTNIER